MPITIPGGVYYLIADAAHVWGVDASYVRRLCAEGRLPAIRIGQLVWLIHSYEVDNRSRPTEDIPPRPRRGSRGRRRRGRGGRGRGRPSSAPEVG